jgi:hypothetical protein
MTLRRPSLVPALALVVALAGTSTANAEITRKKSIWGPTTVNGASAFPIYADLGVGIYQFTVNWAAVAPTRPKRLRDPRDAAYQWPAEVDYAIAEGRKHGIQVSLLVMGTPVWANGGRTQNYAPTRVSHYADFMRAAARRWPQVRHWMIWGEPTRRDNWLPNPTAAEAQGPAKATRPLAAGARRYARLLDAAYGALKAVRRRNLVIGGSTFITGDVGPYNWIRWAQLPGGRPPRMDLWAHNPFGSREPDLRLPLVGPGLADFSDLDTLAGWLDRYQRKNLRLFLSEYQIPTDKPNYEFNFYTTREAQARFLTSALRITRRWKRIYTLGYHTLLDEPPNANGDEVLRGLMDYQGVAKPGYFAFKSG